MKILFVSFVLYLFFCPLLSAQEGSIFLTENEIYPENPANQFKYDVSLSIFSMNGSNWSDESILSEVQKAAQIWRQCDLKIGQVEILKINVSRAALNLSDRDALKMAQNFLKDELKRPAIFLVHEIQGEASVGYSYREQRDFGNQNILRGSIWLPDNILTPAYREVRSQDYSTLAHEIAHVLLNLGHTSLNNILGDTPSRVNGKITTNQCLRLRMSSYVKKL